MASPAVHASGAPGPAGSQQQHQQQTQQLSQQTEQPPTPPASTVTAATDDPARSAATGVPVPHGWRRQLNNGAIVYLSPSGIALLSLSHVRSYLLSNGTCKCGLDCPLRPELVFNFDPRAPSVPWPTETAAGPRNGCLHKRRYSPADIMMANKDMGTKRRKRSLGEWPNSQMALNANQPLVNQQQQPMLSNQMHQTSQQMVAQQQQSMTAQQQHVTHMTPQQQQQLYLQHEQQRQLQQMQQQLHQQQMQQQQHSQQQSGTMRMQQQQQSAMSFQQQGTAASGTGFHQQNHGTIAFQQSQQLQMQQEAMQNSAAVQQMPAQQQQSAQQHQQIQQMPVHQQNMMAHQLSQQQQMAQQLQQLPMHGAVGALQNALSVGQDQILTNQQQMQQVQQHLRQQHQLMQQQQQQHQQQQQQHHHQQQMLQNEIQHHAAVNVQQTNNAVVAVQQEGSTSMQQGVQSQHVQHRLQQSNTQQCYQQQQQLQQRQQQQVMNANAMNNANVLGNEIQQQNHHQQLGSDKETTPAPIRTPTQPPWKQNQQQRALTSNSNERVPPIQQHIQYQQQPQQQQQQQQVAGWTEATTEAHRKKHATSRKNKKPRTTAAPCPNVDVRDIQTQQQTPAYRGPSFMDDPSGYLAQQTALLNNTMHRQQQLEMTTCSAGIESPVPLDASNNILSQFGRPAQKSSPHQQQQNQSNAPSQNQQNHMHNQHQMTTAAAMLNAQILQNCRSCSSSEEENGSGSNTEDGTTYHVHTLPKNMDFMEGITVKEEDPVTSSTFSSAMMDSVASPDCNSKGPIQGGTVSTSHKSPPELMPSPSPTPSLSSRGSDTPSSDRSPNPNITGEMGTGGYTVTSCYAPTPPPPPQAKPPTPTATLKLHPVMAAGNTVARNTITSVLAGRAQTATTSVSGNSSPAQNQMQQLSFQNGNARLVHGGNISLGNIQIQSANGQTGTVNGNGNVQVIGSASQFANGGIQMTRLPSGNVQFVQNIPVQSNQTGAGTVVQQAGIVQNSLGGINLQNQTMINGNGGHIIQQQLTSQQNQQQQNNGSANQQQNIIQNIQTNNQQGHQILQSSKVQHSYNPGHILVSSGGQILMSGNFQGTNLMPPPAPKSIIVGNNGIIQSSTANVQLMSSNGNIVGNTVIANNTPNNVLVASNNGSGNNLLVTNQTGMNSHQNSIINNGGMIIGSNQNIVSNQGILNNGQTLNAQLQGGNSTIQNSNVVQGMVSGNGGNVVIGGSNLLQNNQNIVTNNGGVIQNNGGMLGQQTVLVNAMPAPFVLQQGFTTVDGTHIVGNVIHQQSVVDQDAVRNANNNQFTTRSAILSPESKRKSKKRKPGGQIQQQQQPQQQQQAMVQIQQNVPSQFTPQGFQLSPGLGGLTLVSNKTTPSQILVNNQGATQGSFQTPHINLLQPLNILGPTVQQLIMPQLVMTQDTGILQDATSMPLQLQIQNVNGQNMITPCQSILTTGPGGGVILRAPNPQTKNFISPGGGQFIVQNGQVSPLVTNVSPGQNVNLYGGSVGLVVPTQSGNGQQQNNTQTFVQQNTTIVQQQTTMMSNNNSSTSNCDQNGANASGASNNSSQYLLQSVNNSQVIESGNTINNQQQHGQRQQQQQQQQFIIPVSNAAETTSTVRHKYNVMQTVNTNHHIEQNTMTNVQQQGQQNAQQQNTQFVMQQQQQNTLTIDNNGTQYVVQQAQPHLNSHQQNQHQQLQIQQQQHNQQHVQQMQQQNQQQQQSQQHLQIHQQHNQQQIQQMQQQHHGQQNEHQQFMFHAIKNQQQLGNDSLLNSNSVSTQTAGQQQQQQLHQQQQLQHQQQQQQQQAQVVSLPPPDTTTHSPRSPDRAPSPQSFNMSDRHAMAMVHCISSSEPDSVVSPSADGGNSPPEDFCERAQRGGVYIHNNKPVHYQTELKMRHSPLNQCHQIQFGNNMANPGHHQKLEPAAENAADNKMKNETSAMILRIGDLVWGSARGFPAWPGKIIEPPADDDTVALNDGYRQMEEIQNESVWVRWFGGRSRTVEQVSRSSLQSLSEGLDAHHSARRTARKSRKLNSQLENAIQEAMAELDRISNSGGVQGANNKQCQRLLSAAANAKSSSRSPKPAGPSRQVSKTPVKIAPHPGKVTINNNVSSGPLTNSSGLMATNNGNAKLVKSDDSVTARLRSANNQR